MGASVNKLSRKHYYKEFPTRKSETRSLLKSSAEPSSLFRVTVGDIIRDEKLIAPASVDCTLLDLLDRLSQENLLDLPFTETPDGPCLGQIGIRDFAEYIIMTWKDSKRNSFWEEESAVQHLRNHHLGVIFAMLHHEPCPNHWYTDHLEEVLTLFAAGLERVVVQNRFNLRRAPGYKILTHHTLLKHIAAHPTTINSIASLPAIKFSTPLSRIPRVKAHEPMITALLMMRAFPGMPVAVTRRPTDEDDKLLQPIRRTISLAQAKQLTRSFSLVVQTQQPDPEQAAHQQSQRRGKKKKIEKAEEKGCNEAGTSSGSQLGQQGESIIGYLSESDLVRYFVMLESVFSKMHKHDDEKDEGDDTRGKKSVQSELGTEPLESITVYAYLKEARNAQQRDIGHVVRIPSDATLLDAIRALVRVNAPFVCFGESQHTAAVVEDRLLTTMSILHTIYTENTKLNTSTALQKHPTKKRLSKQKT